LGLAALGKDFMRTEGQAALLQKRIDSINKQAMKGGLMLGLGGAIAGIMKGPYEQAKKLEMERQKFQALNLSASDNALAFSKAQELAHKNLGSTIGDNIAMIADLHTALGDLPSALSWSEDFQKFSIAARIQNDGKPVEGLMYNTAKALEHRGDRVIMNEAERNRELNMLSKVYFGSRGKVSPNDYFHASQTGKMAYTLFDPEFLYGQFAAFIQAKTGPTAGTAAMTYISSILGGHMDNKGKGFLTSLGLWDLQVSPQAKMMQQAVNAAIAKDPEMKAALKKQHMLTPIIGGLAPQFIEMASHRPDEFIQKVVAPRIRERFGMNLSDEQVAGIIMQNLNRNTSDFIGSFITSQHKFEKDAGIFDRAKGFSGAYQQYIKSPEGAELAADEAWKNFLAVFGSVYLPTITNGLLKLAGALDSLGQWVERNPGPVKVLTYAMMGLSGALMFGGTANLLAAAMRGIGLAIGLSGSTGLFGAIAGLANPIGIAVLAIGALAAAFYAFKPLSQAEIDGVKTDGGVKLSAGAQARIDAGALGNGPNVRTGGGAPNVTIHAVMDGTPIHTKVVNTIVRKTSSSLGTGFFDPNASPMTQFNTGH
jgi:hypothetical protein